jgi:predicted HD phosphohydrolase
MNQVQFTQMKDGTREEYVFLQALEHDYIRQLPDRLLQGLQRLDGSLQGYQVSRLEHSLQSATRAEDDGARYR